MAKHQVLHFPIVTAAPIRTRQKSETDLDLAPVCVVAKIPGGADDASVLLVDHDKRAARFHRLPEKFAEDTFLITIGHRVLLPDQRVRRDGKERLPIIRPQRAEPKPLALQSRLQIESHSAVNSNSRSGAFQTAVFSGQLQLPLSHITTTPAQTHRRDVSIRMPDPDMKKTRASHFNSLLAHATQLVLGRN